VFSEKGWGERNYWRSTAPTERVPERITHQEDPRKRGKTTTPIGGFSMWFERRCPQQIYYCTIFGGEKKGWWAHVGIQTLDYMHENWEKGGAESIWSKAFFGSSKKKKRKKEFMGERKKGGGGNFFLVLIECRPEPLYGMWVKRGCGTKVGKGKSWKKESDSLGAFLHHKGGGKGP